MGSYTIRHRKRPPEPAIEWRLFGDILPVRPRSCHQTLGGAVVNGSSRPGVNRPLRIRAHAEGPRAGKVPTALLKGREGAADDLCEMTNAMYTCGLVLAKRDPALCQPISDALTAVGVVLQRLVTRDERPEEIIARADAEGGVPIFVMWDERRKTEQFIADLLTCDTLPGRPYVLFTPDDVVAAVAAEELDAAAPYGSERVLVVNLQEVDSATTRELLRLHLSRACASYLGRTPRTRGVAPAPVTDMPVGERNINNIERRAMQRGMFRIAALRTPRF